MNTNNSLDTAFSSNIENYDERIKLDNVLNNKKNELTPSYKQLTSFLHEYKIRKGETDNYEEIRNFCDVNKKQVYGVPENRIAKLLEHLEECRDEGLKLNFQEYQHEKSSGIMLDFDILLDKDQSVLPEIKFDELIQMLYEIIVTNLNLRLENKRPSKVSSNGDSDSDVDEEDEDPHVIKHAVIIRKTKLSYKEDINKYKDGFHLLFPDIRISRKMKKYLLKKILGCKAIVKFFGKIKLDLHEILDKNSVSVPIFLFGSSKVGGEPYKFYRIFTAKLYQDYVDSVTRYARSIDDYNLICEFSLNYMDSSGLIQNKKRYKPLSNVRDAVEIFNDHHKYKFDDNELDEVNRDISLKNLYIPDINYMQTLLGCINVERLADYNSWIKLIFALANESPDYKSLAIWVSKRVPEKWNPASFEDIWNKAINNKGDTERRLSLRSIIYWAKEDNIKKYTELSNKSIKEIINADIYDDILNGDLLPKQYAKYIYHMFPDKFVTDIQVKDKTHSWYEFILPTDPSPNGYLFKWRYEDKTPDSLTIYLGEKLVQLIREILDEISVRIANEGDESTIKYLGVVKKNLTRSIKKLFTPAFKQQIITEAGLMFRKRGFIESLDKDKHLLGVDNGILDLDKIKLIDTFHDYPVTHSTGVKYVPYDKNNRYIKHVEKVIKDLFPANEMDVHNFIMCYIASCLDGKPKQSIILIITGVGCHSVDTLIRMYNGTNKKVQDIIIGDRVMGDDNTPRLVKELFRGSDQMVKVIPAADLLPTNKPFDVNINHILSLKFDNIGPKIRTIADPLLGETRYDVVWYETISDDGLYEPVRHRKMFLTVEEATNYMDILYGGNVIYDNEIIDIKISNLLKWNKWWILNGNLVLYKINRITSKFTLELLGNDNYYGFELDGNHRYQTADFYIHHNSNGKSFFFEFAKSILGPKYGVKMELAFLTDKRKRSTSADPSLMMLEHARLCHYSETEQNEEMNTARVKEITGQETLSGRNLYEGQKNFRPASHHLITCNHHMTIRTTDHGTWRRIKTYKFKIVFKQDPDPKDEFEKELDPEVAESFATDDRYKQAFLSILVEYYRKLQTEYDGNVLNIPCDTIDKETNQYRQNEDIVSAFIDSRCVVSPNNSQAILDIVELYKTWIIDNIGPALSSNNQQISNILLNSKICKHFKIEEKVYVLKGLRVLDKDDQLTKNEKYLNE